MIHCPHCGATNQDGTRFCIECGQPLPAPNAGGMPCPQCGAENAPGTVFCDDCGTRLVPAPSTVAEQEPEPPAPIKGFSLPKKPTGPLGPLPSSDGSADLPEEVPPWLQKLLSEHGFGVPEEVEEELIPEEPVAAPLVEAELEEEWEEPTLVESRWETEAPATDWLEGLRARSEDWEQETVETQEPLLAPDEEDKDWLRDLDQAGVGLAAPEEVPPLIEPSTVEGEELPDWLRDLAEPGEGVEPAPTAEEISPPTEMPGIEEGELPEWLREVKDLEAAEGDVPPARLTDLGAVEEKEGEPPETPAFVMPEAPAEEAEDREVRGEEEMEAPQWLRDLQEMAPSLEEEMPGEAPSLPDWLIQPAVPGVTIEEDEVLEPDWLQGAEPSDVGVPGEEKKVAPPDWISELGPPVSLLDETEEESVTEVPSWLEELKSATEGPELGEVPPFIGVEAEEISGILGSPAPEASVTEVGEALAGPITVADEESEGLARAEIPDWLMALRPREPGEEPAEEELVELSGPLAGIRGVLPVEPIISLPHLERPETAMVETPSVSGDLFAEIVAQPPPSAAVEPEAAGRRLVAGVQRVLIYLLLLVAVVVPILAGPIYGPLDAEVLQAGAESFHAVLDGQGGVALPEGGVVVVAFDYNPAMAAELSLQARAVADHLMRRGVRVMALSLYPEGAALAQDLLDELAAEWGYSYGEDYIHLGYLPNQPASVRRFISVGPAGEGQSDYRGGQPVSQYAIAQGVGGLSSVDLIVELAGDESAVRTWVEQITARADVPMVAGVSAATAPYVRPYLESGQLRALLVGLPGAAEYEAQAGRPGRAIDSLGSQAAAQAAIVLLIVVGNLVHLVGRRGKK